MFLHMYVRPSVRPDFSKQNKFQATGETVGLAEWIIDDTCLVTIANAKEIYKWMHNKMIFDNLPFHFHIPMILFQLCKLEKND